MSWRISYWRKSTRVRTITIDDSTQDEVASHLRRLATKQSDLEYLPSESDAPENVEIRGKKYDIEVAEDGTLIEKSLADADDEADDD